MAHAQPAHQRNVSPWFPWMVCGLGALFYCYEYFLRVAPSVMTTNLAQAYALSAAGLGNLVAYYYYIYTPMQLPVGVLMDHFGPRRLLIFACLVCAVGTYLFGAPYAGLHLAQTGRFLVGFGSAFAFVGVLKLATIWLPRRYFAMISGSTTTLGLVGATVGTIWLAKLVENVGWRHTLMISAIAGVIIALVIGLLMPDTRGEVDHPEHSQKEDFLELCKEVWLLARNPQIWLNGLVGCLLYLPLSAFAELWGNPYLQATYHFPPQQAATITSTVFIGFAIGSPLFGLLSDRIHRRRLPMIIGALLGGTTIAAALYLPDLSVNALRALLFLFGFFSSAQIIVFAVGHDLCTPRLAGTAMALTNMTVMIGGVIFQPMIGWFIDLQSGSAPGEMAHTAHDYQNALIILPIAMWLTALLLRTVRETNGETQHHLHKSKAKAHNQ